MAKHLLYNHLSKGKFRVSLIFGFIGVGQRFISKWLCKVCKLKYYWLLLLHRISISYASKRLQTLALVWETLNICSQSHVLNMIEIPCDWPSIMCLIGCRKLCSWFWWRVILRCWWSPTCTRMPVKSRFIAPIDYVRHKDMSHLQTAILMMLRLLDKCRGSESCHVWATPPSCIIALATKFEASCSIHASS